MRRAQRSVDMTYTVAEAGVVVNEVTGGAMLSVLPRYLGRYMIAGEGLVYNWMRKLSDDYDGNEWRFYTLSNDGFYMAPRGPERLLIQYEGNAVARWVSADAAGILATLLALGQLWERYEDDTLALRHHALLAYVRQHPERAKIQAVLD
jgi:hypothetical protein